MARPARFNADYFTHSADLRNDRRVKAIRTAYGAAGYGLFIMLLEALTDSDNTALPIDEMELELLAGDFGVSATDIHSLSQFGIKVGYFTKNDAGLLTCPELNSWLAPVFDKRNRARNTAQAGLLPQDNTETGVSVTVNPQSKVKESKVNTITDSASPSPEGGEVLKASKKSDVVADPALSFETFWNLYGKKEGPKSKLAKKWDALPVTERKHILAHLSTYRAYKTVNGPQYMPDPQTFLNGQFWANESYGQTPTVASAQPMGQVANPMRFDQNPAAIARQAEADAQQLESLMQRNAERIRRNEGTAYGAAGETNPNGPR